MKFHTSVRRSFSVGAILSAKAIFIREATQYEASRAVKKKRIFWIARQYFHWHDFIIKFRKLFTLLFQFLNGKIFSYESESNKRKRRVH